MIIVRWLAALCAALFLCSPALAGPVSLYGKLPEIEGVDISPNGKLLALILTDGEKRRISVFDWDNRKAVAGIGGGDVKVRDVQWADDDTLMITVSQTTTIPNVIAPRNDWSMVIVFNVKTGVQKPLLNDRTGSSLNVILDRPVIRQVDGKPVSFVQGVYFLPSGQGARSILRTDLATNRTRLSEAGVPDTRDFLLDSTGEVAAEVQYNDRRGTYKLRMRDGKTMREAELPADTESVSLAGFSQDGKSVLVRYQPKEKESVLAEATISGGEWRKIDGSEDQGAMFDPATNRFMGLSSLKGDVTTTTYSNPADQRVWNGILKAFPGQKVRPVGWSTDRKRIVVLVDDFKESPAYMLVDIPKGEASMISPLYGQIKEANVSPVKAIRYKAADGTEISGYLTLPRGKGEKNLPLIVLPHGGPAARDTLGFDWWSQALASRGYAVLRPNFRGSAGFGTAFLEAGFGEFGRKMQTDLSDGVRYLAAEGTIDPKRVCIAGASYGGYAALAGATLDTGVYRCAASVAGPADLRRMLVTERNDSGDTSFRYWKRFMGVDGLRDPDLAAISPVAHADKVTIPVLLVHGKDDTVVLYEQSRLMADAMKKAGKPVEFVTLPSEDHWLSRGVTRTQMLDTVTAFLEKNNPPD